MKLPNGYGTVFKLKGNRRKPWVVKKTMKGKQVCLGYFPTFDTAMDFLVMINKNTPLIEIDSTFKDIYNKWKAIHFSSLSASSIKGYEISYSHCKDVQNMKFIKMKYIDVQSIIDTLEENGVGYSTQKKVKGLIIQLYDFAIKYGISHTNFGQYIELYKSKPNKKKTPFSNKEIKTLWNNKDNIFVQDILILIYTGLRIGEFLNLKSSNIDLRKRTIKVTQSKTQAGIRIVPINKKILWIFQSRVSNEYICNNNDGKYTYHSYRPIFDNVLKLLGMNHTPHETRHTCATLLNRAGANEVAIKKILGHSLSDLTQRVYTHKTKNDLQTAIDKI